MPHPPRRHARPGSRCAPTADRGLVQPADIVFAELDQRAGCGRVGIACSGGSDSLALLLLASDWARQNGRSLHVLTVDHALRAESRAEAEFVSGVSARLGWPCDVLNWDAARPGSGLQSRARAARHALLASACRRHGLPVLLMAHTRDDQAETVALRLAAGGNWHSATGMAYQAPSPAWPEGRDLTLVRPCLGVSRSTLRAVLTQRGERWIDDPSNTDPHYARIRMRDRLARLRTAGFLTERLAALAEDLAPIQLVERRSAWLAAQTCLVLRDWGGAEIELAAWAGITPTVRLTLLEALVSAISGQALSPSRARLQPLDAALLSAQPRSGCGVGLLPPAKGRAMMIRDRGALFGRVDHAASQPWLDAADGSRVFDGRFEIRAGANDLDWAVMGDTYEGLQKRAILDAVPGAARPGLLVARRRGRIVTIAGLDAGRADENNESVTAAQAVRPLIAHRFCRRLLPESAGRWFDASRAA